MSGTFIAGVTCDPRCANHHATFRFKNFEAGRLTAFPELPRALTPVDVNGSGTNSQMSLAKPENDEKFQEQKIQETEAQDYFNFEDCRWRQHWQPTRKLTSNSRNILSNFRLRKSRRSMRTERLREWTTITHVQETIFRRRKDRGRSGSKDINRN